ncbi:MAG: rhamnulokinase [Propionibacteriaceae bacterium]|nr:rhamnulokinase [Propionibacteriaceae bacterium]
MTDPLFAAVDLGAGSGRVILGCLRDGRFTMEEVHRFDPVLFCLEDHLHWDAMGHFDQILIGLRAGLSHGELRGIGVDTWGVDYGRINPAGELIEPPFHYRDSRTQGIPQVFFRDFSAQELYDHAGLQVMEFNTIFQMASSALDAGWNETAACLFLPDLFTYFLCGATVAELTNASTSGLLDVSERTWSPRILGHMQQRYGIDLARVLPPIVEPGTTVGVLHPQIHPGEIPVISVASHDTASAICAIPAQTTKFAYISSGTWSLAGLELDHPILSEESRLANFTNELGVDGTVHYLRNVMGLWVLSQSCHHWKLHGPDIDLADLLDGAAKLPALVTVVDMEDPRLLHPGDMPSRLAAMAAETDQIIPTTPGEFVRCILDSLALDYRRVIAQASRLANTEPEVVHIVGGGSRNELLNQLSAEALGLPVIAGPAEGTALGNLLVQARAVGAVSGDLTDLRRISRSSCTTKTYTPGVFSLPQSAWDDAERRAYS